MKWILLALILFSISLVSCAQISEVEQIRESVSPQVSEAHIRFLAADELKGRAIGTPELDLAARYIAEQFRSFGLRTFPQADDYFQKVPLFNHYPPETTELQVDNQVFGQGMEMAVVNGPDDQLTGELFFLKGPAGDNSDLSGKIVVAQGDTATQEEIFGFLTAGKKKANQVAERGALAYLEVYQYPGIPWSAVVGGLHQKQMHIENQEGDTHIPFLLLSEDTFRKIYTKRKSVGSLTIQGFRKLPIPAKNVVGYIPGTDPELKEQYLVLSAHYDHIGTTQSTLFTDSVYNGARDNAVGTTALLNAARYFGKNPPKRSVIFLALTAEEIGLVGSRWFVEHPLVPLEKIVFNLNSDEAGYNDTTLVTVIGLYRTSAEQNITQAAQLMGFDINDDPAPEQNLYDRSDNVSFAKVGIPAINLSPGMTGFDQEIMKYYHKVTDEANTLNFLYLERVFETYILVAQKIANSTEVPFWRAEDKYEPSGKKLYGL